MTAQTKAALKTEISAQLPDNTTGLVTPAIMRTVLDDMVDSWLGVVDPNTNQITNGMLAQAAGRSVKGNAGASTGNLSDLTNPAILGLSIVPTGSTLGQGLQVTQTGAGSTVANAGQNYNYITVNSDAADTGNSPATSFAVGLLINQAFGGLAATGGRYGVISELTQTAATNASNAVRFYAAVGGQAQANASDGGTIGGGNEKGKQYGSNFLGVLANGATGFEQCSAGYDQIFLQAGSSAKTKIIRQFVYGSTDAVQGSTYDAAIGISAETGAGSNGKFGILIGNFAGAQPLAASATILGLTGSPTIATGIDLSGGTLTTPFKSNAYSVDGGGNIFGQNQAAIFAVAKAVNFNAGNTDTAITITLPSGVTNYLITAIRIGNASHDISTATFGLFSAVSGGGTAIQGAGTTITVTATAANTNNNSQATIPTNGNTQSFNFATLQFRVGTAEGAAATADVLLNIVPLY